MEDIVGKKFGKLTVIAFDKKQGSMSKWICKCDCGNIQSVRKKKKKNKGFAWKNEAYIVTLLVEK